MIMYEFIMGKIPFKDQEHDIELKIKICDGFRPSITTNAPGGYIKLMQECWNSNPNKRPKAADIVKRLSDILRDELNNPTEITPINLIMENIKSILTEAGIDFSNIVKTSIFLKDMQNFAQVNEVYGTYFSDHFPARETVQVAGLPKNVNVEITVTAIKP